MLYYIRDDEGALEGFKYNDIVYYYEKNLTDDIIGILNQNKEKIATYEYDSWSNILYIKDENENEITDSNHIAIINPFRYRSYYYDKETNLYYLNSRYYNPRIKRFINADVYLMINQGSNGYNLYCYVSNNPINNVDPNGNLFKKIVNKLKKAWNSFKNLCKTAGNIIKKTVGYESRIGKSYNAAAGSKNLLKISVNIKKLQK